MNDLWSEPNRLAVERAVTEREEIASDLLYVVGLYEPIELQELLEYLSRYSPAAVSRAVSSGLAHGWLQMYFVGSSRVVSLGANSDSIAVVSEASP